MSDISSFDRPLNGCITALANWCHGGTHRLLEDRKCLECKSVTVVGKEIFGMLSWLPGSISVGSSLSMPESLKSSIMNN